MNVFLLLRFFLSTRMGAILELIELTLLDSILLVEVQQQGRDPLDQGKGHIFLHHINTST
jgi:hypothetical protein